MPRPRNRDVEKTRQAALTERIPIEDEERLLEIIRESYASGNDESETYGVLSEYCPDITPSLMLAMEARRIGREPEWKVNAIARKFGMTGFAKIGMRRKLVRMDDTGVALEVLGRKDRAWARNPEDEGGTRRINSPITLLLMPEIAEKVRALDEAVKRQIIEADYVEKKTQD